MGEKSQNLSWLPKKEALPGIIVCAVIAALAYLTNTFVYGKISPLMYAFLYSIILGNVIKLPKSFSAGILWCSSSWLRFSIAMLGLTISALAWLQLGIVGVIQVLIVIAFALFFGVWFGRKMGLSPELSILMGAGCSICGATAIAAVGPVIKAKDEELGIAVAAVTVFGLIAMILYPFLFQSTALGDFLHKSQIAFGMWAGTGIHETAQVIPAGAQVGEKAAAMALVAKSVRIFSIGPVVLLCAYIFNRIKGSNAAGTKQVRLGIPSFAIFFVLFSLINSLLLYLPSTKTAWKDFYTAVHYADVIKVFLAVAFAGVGFKVHYSSIQKLGVKSFVVGMIVSVAVGVLALLLVKFIYMPYSGI
ncbi:YeiH family protein [Carboxydothermus pertinax]|uniref:Membrane protein n=1 Tax=Carboxydothermus pertinax TaxID=870242 RepID=A0A1L8CWI0_9THEO|nr:putative sulfate exporter family transporter [Carboxydothermus pertinax]GAV23224.1 membrane protein [Carboxydothermus pertinax]